MAKKLVAVRVEEGLWAAVQSRARRMGCTVTRVVEGALRASVGRGAVVGSDPKKKKTGGEDGSGVKSDVGSSGGGVRGRESSGSAGGAGEVREAGAVLAGGVEGGAGESGGVERAVTDPKRSAVEDLF